MNRSVYRSNVYNNEYYSGEQAMLYIGDVFVDEIVSYEYSVVENRMPIRGYASRRFDTMTMGTVEVHGQFTINYKESGYLWAILRRFYNITQSHGIEENLGPKEAIGPLYSAVPGQTRHNIMRANYERLAKLSATGKPIPAEMVDFAHTINGMLTGRHNGVGAFDPEAENIFEEYENIIWGTRSETPARGIITYDEDPMGIDFRKETDPHWQGFDIVITHGDYSGSDYKNHTVRRIENIHLLSAQQAADPSGQPILEMYTFIAQDRV